MRSIDPPTLRLGGMPNRVASAVLSACRGRLAGGWLAAGGWRLAGGRWLAAGSGWRRSRRLAAGWRRRAGWRRVTAGGGP